MYLYVVHRPKPSSSTGLRVCGHLILCALHILFPFDLSDFNAVDDGIDGRRSQAL